MSTAKILIADKDIPWENTGEGVKRKIMAFDKSLMIVKVQFESGAVGTPHSHPHSQATHIESGVFKVTIGDEHKILSKGDAFYIPPGIIHGVVCLEAGVLIDAFSPMREDFINERV